MRLYALMSGMFPNSFTAKVFCIAFLGTHVPLIAIIAYALAGRQAITDIGPVLLLVLFATLAGTGATLLALRLILAPLFRVESAMRAFEQDGTVQPLPSGYEDEVGRLMQRTNRLVLNVGRRLDETTRAAETDPLTGVLNRRGFQARVGDPVTGAVLHLDLDRFKAINDAHGHDTGDQVLCDVAAAVQSVLRRGDVLARFGGEEFVLFLPQTDSAAAMAVAERIRATVAAEVRAGQAAVTASLGVAVSASPVAVDRLIARADAATYAAKQAGRNQVRADDLLHAAE